MTQRCHLVIVLCEQIEIDAAAFDGFDAAVDAVWRVEVVEESTHVWSSQPRIAIFLSAMRHFAEALRGSGRPLHFRRLDDHEAYASLAASLQAAITRLRPAAPVMASSGDARVQAALRAVAEGESLALDIRGDRHFFSAVHDFAAHAGGRKQVRMEYLSRELRRKRAVPMDGGEPAGGQWNFDADNRESFCKGGPAEVPERARCGQRSHGYGTRICRRH